MASITLECRELVKVYGRQPVLNGVSLQAHAGEILALLGPSGCGKTTTLRLIAGFETLDSGTITIDGRLVADGRHNLPPEERRVGMVFQEYALFPHLSVADNISFGLRGSGRAARVDEMLALVALSGLGRRMPHELSGGQQQRVALARALAPQPQVLLLDEPFSNLDTALRAQVRTEISAILRRSGITCVIVTHDQEEALSLADQVAVMFDGQIAQASDPQTLYRQPVSRQVASFVGEANFIPAHAHGDHADSSLGMLPLAQPSQGEVELMLRPEQLLLDSATDGISAEVLWREFYGHDQRISLALADGTRIVARADASDRFAAGQQVLISVRGSVQPFAAVR